VEGAITGGIGYVVVQQLLTYAPLRFQGLTVVIFALGALTYARHPEGIVEFLKRKQTMQIQRLLFKSDGIGDQRGRPPTSLTGPEIARMDAGGEPSPVEGAGVRGAVTGAEHG
jgi:hypothetical protein